MVGAADAEVDWRLQIRSWKRLIFWEDWYSDMSRLGLLSFRSFWYSGTTLSANSRHGTKQAVTIDIRGYPSATYDCDFDALLEVLVGKWYQLSFYRMQGRGTNQRSGQGQR